MRKSTRLALLLLGLIALGALTGCSAASEKGAKKDGSKKKGGIKWVRLRFGFPLPVHLFGWKTLLGNLIAAVVER